MDVHVFELDESLFWSFVEWHWYFCEFILAWDDLLWCFEQIYFASYLVSWAFLRNMKQCWTVSNCQWNSFFIFFWHRLFCCSELSFLAGQQKNIKIQFNNETGAKTNPGIFVVQPQDMIAHAGQELSSLFFLSLFLHCLFFGMKRQAAVEKSAIFVVTPTLKTGRQSVVWVATKRWETWPGCHQRSLMSPQYKCAKAVTKQEKHSVVSKK